MSAAHPARRLSVGVANQQVARRHGQGRVALELCRALLDAGHDVTVYTRQIDDEMAAQVVVRRLPSVPGLPGLLDEFVMIPTVSWAMRKGRHDVSLTIGACGVPPKPYVLNAQFAQPGWRRSWTDANRPSFYHRAHARLSELVEGRLVRRADLVIASTPVVAHDVTNGASTPVAVVPNGIALDEFPVVTPERRAEERRRFGLPDDAFVIAFVGEYATTRKGLDFLLQAVAAGAGDEHVLVAGTGRDEEMQARAAALGIGGRVHLVGFAPPVDAFAAADLAAVPSVYEPFSLVALEAAASGIPLVTSAAVGAAALLGEGVVTVDDPTQPDQLREAIDEVRAPGRRTAMAAAARAAAEQLTWQTTMAGAVAAIEAVAEGRAGEFASVVRGDVAGGSLRVLFVDHQTRLSGGELDLVDLEHALPAGVDAHVALPGEGPLADALRAEGATVHVVAMGEGMRSVSRWDLARRPWRAAPQLAAAGGAARSLQALTRQLRPHAIHSNSMKAHLLSIPAAAMTRTPHLWHVRDILQEGWLRGAFSKIAGREAARILCISRAVADSFEPPAAEKTRVTYNGVRIPTESYAAEAAAWHDRFRADEGTIVVGIVGQIARWKGQDVFLDAAARLQGQAPGRFRFVVVGRCLFPENEGDFDASIRRQAKSLGLDDDLTWISDARPIEPVMRAFDVFVHASRLPEPFGRVIVEALAQGTPVVTTSIGAGPEIVPPSAGRVVAPDDAAAVLAGAVAELAAGGRGAIACLADDARAAAERFDIAHTADAVLDVYRELGLWRG